MYELELRSHKKLEVIKILEERS